MATLKEGWIEPSPNGVCVKCFYDCYLEAIAYANGTYKLEKRCYCHYIRDKVDWPFDEELVKTEDLEELGFEITLDLTYKDYLEEQRLDEISNWEESHDA
jgi:hypothetical protein